jgi:hypothetical protein
MFGSKVSLYSLAYIWYFKAKIIRSFIVLNVGYDYHVNDSSRIGLSIVSPDGGRPNSQDRLIPGGTGFDRNYKDGKSFSPDGGRPGAKQGPHTHNRSDKFVNVFPGHN